MRELLRTNDAVTLSFVDALLTDAGIDHLVLDGHTSALEGSIGAIQRRLVVADADLEPARSVLREADLGHLVA